MHRRRPDTRHPSSGTARPAGIVIALATALATFAIGMVVLPPAEKPAPEPTPPVALSPPPAPATPPPVPVPSADAAAPADAATAAPADAKAALPSATDAKAEPAAPAKADAASGPDAKPEADAAKTEEAPAAKTEAAASREKGAEKDVAREAWRKNQPDVSVDGGKATMIIPIKGSIEGATYHVTNKPRSVLVTMPKAEAMITMPFYTVDRGGFRKLWIKKDEQGTTTTLKVTLGADVGEPQAEVKEDYVRVTVRRLAEAPDEGGKSEKSNKSDKSDKSEKSEKSEKPAPEAPTP